ncbi:5-hydroxytryptamine receptor 4-like [Lineus longissimus]|uniref:5-hydroxytryptamine receptor 4-like n=1 Tax=Lineus longissimus TaxID=88925 RepID=UPI00315D33BE
MNITCPEGPGPIQHSDAGRVILGIFLVLVILLTLAGNFMVIASVYLFRQLQSVTNAFIVSLAAADALVAVLVMPFSLYQNMSTFTWHLGETMCLVATSFDVMFTTTSILHLMCMAVDRYLAICHPFLYNDRMTKPTVIGLLIMCWILPLFISFFPILNRWNILGIEEVDYCVNQAGSCVFLVNRAYAIICSAIAFYIPTVFMLVCNIKIYQTARKQVMQIRSLEIKTPGAMRASKNMRQETKAAKTIGIIVGVYSLCWFPFFIFNVVDPFIDYTIHPIPWSVAIWLGYINSTINPFLYYFFNRSFRTAFTKILMCSSCRMGDFDDNFNNTTMSAVSE